MDAFHMYSMHPSPLALDPMGSQNFQRGDGDKDLNDRIMISSPLDSAIGMSPIIDGSQKGFFAPSPSPFTLSPSTSYSNSNSHSRSHSHSKSSTDSHSPLTNELHYLDIQPAPSQFYFDQPKNSVNNDEINNCGPISCIQVDAQQPILYPDQWNSAGDGTRTDNLIDCNDGCLAGEANTPIYTQNVQSSCLTGSGGPLLPNFSLTDNCDAFITSTQEDWPVMETMGSFSVDSPKRTQRRGRSNQSQEASSPRGQGIRKKNARYYIPPDRNLENIEGLINQATNDKPLERELRVHRRLLRNRHAALASRQRKKEHIERLEEDNQKLKSKIIGMQTTLAGSKSEISRLLTQQAKDKQSLKNLQRETEDLTRQHAIELKQKSCESLASALTCGESKIPVTPDQFHQLLLLGALVATKRPLSSIPTISEELHSVSTTFLNHEFDSSDQAQKITDFSGCTGSTWSTKSSASREKNEVESMSQMQFEELADSLAHQDSLHQSQQQEPQLDQELNFDDTFVDIQSSGGMESAAEEFAQLLFSNQVTDNVMDDFPILAFES